MTANLFHYLTIGMKSRSLYLFLILLLLCSKQSDAQNDSLFYFFKEINYPVTDFTVNIPGEMFVVSLDGQLKKYNVNGDSVGVFNQVKKYGNLGYIEAQNPWQTLLFYPDFETIVILDKYLNSLGSINLRDKNIFGVKAITNSYDNKIWIYDAQENKIKKLDQNGNNLMASADLRQVFDSVPNPTKLIDRDGLLYLYDPAMGIYIFDYYGAFKIRMALRGWNSLSVIGQSIYGIDNESLYKLTPPGTLPLTFPLPISLQKAEQAQWANQKVYILKNNLLRIYNLR